MNRTIKFRSAPDFPKYEIGNNGSVWSLDYNHTGKRKRMSQYLDKDGYPYIFFVVNGKRFKRIIHRMVAVLFVKNPDGKPQVNHKNSNRADNRFVNLEWVTSQENCIHGWESGREVSQKAIDSSRARFSGANNPKAKANEATVLSVRRLRAKGVQFKDISERTGLSISQCSSIASGKSWKYLSPSF